MSVARRTRIVIASVLLPIVALAALLAGCGNPAETQPTLPPEAVADEIRYTCGGAPFDMRAVADPGRGEAGEDDLAAALRAALAPGGLPEAGLQLPRVGWHQVGRDIDTGEFVNFTGRPLYIRFERRPDGVWSPSAWGDCQPQIVLTEGLGVATWVLDPAQPAPGPEATSFSALVTERGCSGGQSAAGRILEPRVLPLEDQILVVFAVRPLEGPQPCPGNPETRVTVELGEPLGERELVDPSVLFTE